MSCRCDEEYVATLKKSNDDLKDENEALKEKVADLSYLLSGLRREIRHVEEERQSLVTAIKILQHDYQNVNDGSDQLNHDEDKSSGHNFNNVPSKWAKKGSSLVTKNFLNHLRY